MLSKEAKNTNQEMIDISVMNYFQSLSSNELANAKSNFHLNSKGNSQTTPTAAYNNNGVPNSILKNHSKKKLKYNPPTSSKKKNKNLPSPWTTARQLHYEESNESPDAPVAASHSNGHHTFHHSGNDSNARGRGRGRHSREVVEAGEGAEEEEEVLSPINRKEEEEGIHQTNKQGPKEVKFLLFTNRHRVSTWMETF